MGEGSAVIQTIHAQLSAWGRWVIRPETRAVGYPTRSAGFGDYLPSGSEYKSRPPLGFGCDDDMLAINNAVLLLRKEDRAICAEFYVVGPSWESVCSRVAMSKSVLYRELDRIHRLIETNIMRAS